LVKLSALLLVGADGARSRVAMGIRKSRPRRLIRGFGAEAVYHANPLQDHVEIFFDQKSAPGWFAWTIPLGDGIARLGTGSANGMPARESLQRMRARFPESLGSATFTSRTGGSIALWEPSKIVDDRVLLVGDAARQVKPTSGGGILTGLLSASLAAETAADALRGGDLSSTMMASYPARWEVAIGRELRRQYDMRRAFDRLGQRQLNRLLGAVSDPRIWDKVAGLADIDFPSYLAWQVARYRPWTTLKAATLPRFPRAWLPSAAIIRSKEDLHKLPGHD
jgi:flavin-dependent dehydrogenase